MLRNGRPAFPATTRGGSGRRIPVFRRPVRPPDAIARNPMMNTRVSPTRLVTGRPRSRVPSAAWPSSTSFAHRSVRLPARPGQRRHHPAAIIARPVGLQLLQPAGLERRRGATRSKARARRAGWRPGTYPPAHRCSSGWPTWPASEGRRPGRRGLRRAGISPQMFEVGVIDAALPPRTPACRRRVPRAGHRPISAAMRNHPRPSPPNWPLPPRVTTVFGPVRRHA